MGGDEGSINGEERPDTGPSPQRRTTPKWPAVCSGIPSSRQSWPECVGWSSQPQVVQSKMDVSTQLEHQGPQASPWCAARPPLLSWWPLYHP